MREGCNIGYPKGLSQPVLFQFMYARGLQPSGFVPVNFDSCMRKDCNKIHHRVRYPWRNFNSCMRKDCNLLLFGGRVAFVYFDSCMREDCNKPGVSGGGASFILIHACAKIATQKAQEWEEWAAF